MSSYNDYTRDSKFLKGSSQDPYVSDKQLSDDDIQTMLVESGRCAIDDKPVLDVAKAMDMAMRHDLLAPDEGRYARHLWPRQNDKGALEWCMGWLCYNSMEIQVVATTPARAFCMLALFDPEIERVYNDRPYKWFARRLRDDRNRSKLAEVLG